MKQLANNKKDFSAIVLAAGKSERLGFPKLSLRYDDKNTFIEQIVKNLNEFNCREIVLVVNETGIQYLKRHNITFEENVVIVLNENPDWHRFYSLKKGVQNLSELQAVFVHNVDNPFVRLETLKELWTNRLKADYLFPEYQAKGGHPILLSPNIVKEVFHTEARQIHFREFLAQFSKLAIPVQDTNILVNINTLREYRRYFDAISDTSG